MLFRSPVSGPTRMYHENFDPFEECDYIINGNDRTGAVILQHEEWEYATQTLHIVLGSIVLAKIEVRTNDRIFMDFVEIINLVNHPDNQ